MLNTVKNAAFAIAASGMVLSAAPAAAIDLGAPHVAAPQEGSWSYGDRDRYDRDDRGRGRGRGRDNYRSDDRRYESVGRNTRVWRGNDGRTYCQKKDGTTGLIVGGAAGALLGREVDSRGDRTLGTVLGAAAGALLGKQVAQGMSCR